MKATVEIFLESKYQKIKLIKESKRSEIWLASDSSNNLYIYKKLYKSNEAYKILKQNPNKIFPQVIYCAEFEESMLIVEEYIQGESLFERIKQKKYLSEIETKNYLLQLCDGLQFLHQLNIIHRDIKPEHIIIRGNEVKLIDFDSVHIYKEHSTEDTELLGTKGYAPPEQYGFSQSDSRNDIYSLGVTFLKATKYFHSILSKCIEKNPDDRFQSANELKYAILNHKPRIKNLLITFMLIEIFLLSIHNEAIEEEIPIEKSEKKIIKQNDVKIQSKEKYQFPEIKLPETHQQIEINQTNEIYQPTEIHKPFETHQPIQNEQTIEKIIGDFVKVEYYANGQRLNEWTDSVDYDVDNAGTIQNVNKNVWNQWQIEGEFLKLPPNYLNLQIRLVNYSDKIFHNVQVEVEDYERKFFNGRDLSPKEGITFDVPINQLRLSNSKAIIKIKVIGNGVEIRCSGSEYELNLLED